MPKDFQPDTPVHLPPNPLRAEFPSDPLKIIPSHSILPPSAKKIPALPDVWQEDLPHNSLFWDAMSIE